MVYQALSTALLRNGKLSIFLCLFESVTLTTEQNFTKSFKRYTVSL